MDYKNKLLKYIAKINYAGGDIEMRNLPIKRTDMILYIITNIIGGTPDDIISIINTEYKKLLDMNKLRKKNYKLGIKQIDKIPAKINFRIIPPSNSEEDTVLFKKGTYTAIYNLVNVFDKTDNKKYILRLFDNTKIHLCDLLKTKTEFDIFKKYVYNVYYWGTVNILETGKAKPHKIDYVITKLYNSDISGFTENQKLIFLRNNIQMLLDLRNLNYFHADYKLSNIGWTDDLNIVLIDYDQNTLIKIDKSMITDNKLNFPFTYLPKYLKISNIEDVLVNKTDYTKYDKFSVGGLVTLIYKLKLKDNLISEFKLEDSYENIFTYEKMLAEITKKLV